MFAVLALFLAASSVAIVACGQSPLAEGTPGGAPGVSVPPATVSPSSVPDGAPGTSATPWAATPGPAQLGGLAGTSWLVVAIDGVPVNGALRPRVTFDLAGRPGGTGYTGCDEFGFDATFNGAAITIGDLLLPPFECAGPGADIEKGFLAVLAAADTWSTKEDELTLRGVGGRLTLARELPPAGDPARMLADALRDGEWRLVEAPGVADVAFLPPIIFGDTALVAVGPCGISGRIAYSSGGTVSFTEIGWDSTGCPSRIDGRPALQPALEAVTSGRIEQADRIVLEGGLGEIVLGR